MVPSKAMTGRPRQLESVGNSCVLPRLKYSLVVVLCFCVHSHAVEWQGRLKGFASNTMYPDHALLKQLNGSPQQDYSVDLRNVFNHRQGAWTILLDHELTFVGGDSRGIPAARIETQVRDDDRRWWDLTWELAEGSRHRLTHRLDRLAVEYRRRDLSVSFGRQAVSWGYGIVFQPADFVNPFAPTDTDRDYKPGDDLALAQYLLGNGSDLQAIAVGRRNEDGDFSGASASVGGKWHGFAGPIELDVIAAKHYRDQVYAFGLIVPVKGAVIRSQWVGTRLSGGDWKHSAVVNGDYSVGVANRMLYLYAEYYRNGFGSSRTPDSILDIDPALRERLARGEVFTLARHYAAVGASYQWHPLLTQSLLALTNLTDPSVLLQTTLVYDAGDHHRLEAGVVWPTGSKGDEFGGVFTTPDATVGSGTSTYLRYLFYF